MVYNFLIKKKKKWGAKASVNEVLAQELQKPVFKKFKKKKTLCKV